MGIITPFADWTIYAGADICRQRISGGWARSGNDQPRGVPCGWRPLVALVEEASVAHSEMPCPVSGWPQVDRWWPACLVGMHAAFACRICPNCTPRQRICGSSASVFRECTVWVAGEASSTASAPGGPAGWTTSTSGRSATGRAFGTALLAQAMAALAATVVGQRNGFGAALLRRARTRVIERTGRQPSAEERENRTRCWSGCGRKDKVRNISEGNRGRVAATASTATLPSVGTTPDPALAVRRVNFATVGQAQPRP